MTKDNLHAVIMAGGSGTRFWPLSRAARPKQLLDLTGGRTMIQATVDRLGDLAPAERTWVITNHTLTLPIAEQLPQLARSRILGEPCKRDTAPAIGLAALLVMAVDPEATLVVMPADHLIDPPASFQAAIRQAAELVEERPETLVTFGIRPTYPAETFGYIERGSARSQESGVGGQTGGRSVAFDVKCFREKPARSIAEQYVASGNFYWNSGIFVWKARTILNAIGRFEPEMHEYLQSIAAAIGREDFPSVLDRDFTAIRGKSIDFAVMERYQPVVVIEAPFGWDDVGSWQSLARSIGVDAEGNAVQGKHLGIRTTDSIVRSTADHLVVTLGVSGCIVVHTPDATLVADKRQEEAIREVVQALAGRAWHEFLNGRRRAAMAMTSTAYDPRFLQGIEHFNVCDFYEAHEVWEELWADYQGPSRRFYQGLIQVAVCLHHFGNGNIRGAKKLYHSSRDYLKDYLPRHEGVDVAKLFAQLETCCREILDSTEEYPKIEIVPDLIPEIHLES